MANGLYFNGGSGGGGGTTGVSITASDFTGDDYQNDSLIGKIADQDFAVMANGGSGTLLKVGVSYEFDSSTGTITAAPDDYRVIIY